MKKRSVESGSARDGDAETTETAESETLLDLLAEPRAKPSAAAARPVEGIVIGSLSRLGELGEAFVTLPGRDDEPLSARSLTPLCAEHVGRSVALMFESGDPARPILMGVVHDPMDELIARRTGREQDAAPRIEAQVDDESVVLEATRQIVLRCGKASITLSPDGRISVRGTDLLSRSSGGHRIQGASVAIN